MDIKNESRAWCNQGQAVHSIVTYVVVPGWFWCNDCGCWQKLEASAVACCG